MGTYLCTTATVRSLRRSISLQSVTWSQADASCTTITINMNARMGLLNAFGRNFEFVVVSEDVASHAFGMRLRFAEQFDECWSGNDFAQWGRVRAYTQTAHMRRSENELKARW
jgi:hypothetical protein